MFSWIMRHPWTPGVNVAQFFNTLDMSSRRIEVGRCIEGGYFHFCADLDTTKKLLKAVIAHMACKSSFWQDKSMYKIIKVRLLSKGYNGINQNSGFKDIDGTKCVICKRVSWDGKFVE